MSVAQPIGRRHGVLTRPLAWYRAAAFRPADTLSGTISDAVYSLTLQRARVLSLIVIGVDLVLFFAFDYANYAAGRWVESEFYRLGVIWRVVTVSGFIAHLAADTVLRRRYDVIGRPHRVLAVAYCAFVLAMGTSQSIIQHLVVPDVSIFALCVLVVATVLHVPNHWNRVFFIGALGALVAGISALGAEGPMLAGLATNAASVVIVAFVLERLTYRNKVRNLQDQRTILRKNEEIERAYNLAAEELREAREVQLALLPQQKPSVPGLELAAVSTPAAHVGGDYYDWRVDERGVLTAVIGDATGHGAAAGAMVTATKAVLTDALSEASLSDALHRASDTLRRLRLPRLYMALAVVRVDGGRIELAGAGMPPALIWRAASRTVETVPLKGAPLGSPLPYPYHVQEVNLNEGDVVALLSDGLIERRDPRGREMGWEDVLRVAGRVAGGSADEVVSGIVDAASAWACGTPQHDDLTVVVIKKTVSAHPGGDGAAPSDVAAPFPTTVGR